MRECSFNPSQRTAYLAADYRFFAECSIDYTKDSEVAYHFYATIQNKFHYAITNHTAAEIVYESADHEKEHMGLTTWNNAPDGRILKSDVSIAKNYLEEKQIRRLERAVTGYFDYIEYLIELEKEGGTHIWNFGIFMIRKEDRWGRLMSEEKNLPTVSFMSVVRYGS